MADDLAAKKLKVFELLFAGGEGNQQKTQNLNPEQEAERRKKYEDELAEKLKAQEESAKTQRKDWWGEEKTEVVQDDSFGNQLKQGLIEERIAEWFGEDQLEQLQANIAESDKATAGSSQSSQTSSRRAPPAATPAPVSSEKKKSRRMSMKFWSSGSKKEAKKEAKLVKRTSSKNLSRRNSQGFSSDDEECAEDAPCLEHLTGGKFRVRVRYHEGRPFSAKVDRATQAGDICLMAQRKFGMDRRLFKLWLVEDGKESRALKDSEKAVMVVQQVNRNRPESSPATLSFVNFPKSKQVENTDMQSSTLYKWLGYKLGTTRETPGFKDLRNGLLLCQVIQKCWDIPTLPERLTEKPKKQQQRVENFNCALSMLSDQRVILPKNCSGKTLESNEEMLLSLLRTIFVADSCKSLDFKYCAEFFLIDKILAWAQRSVKSCKVEIDGFNLCFENGRAFAALCAKWLPGNLDFEEAKRKYNGVELVSYCFGIFHKYASVPLLLSPQFFDGGKLDSFSLLAYLSTIYITLRTQRQKKLKRRSVIPGMAPVNTSSVIVRVYFEGFKDMDFKSFAFYRGMPASEAYTMLAVSMKPPLDPQEFVLLRVFRDGTERIMRDHDLMLLDGNSEKDQYIVKKRNRGSYVAGNRKPARPSPEVKRRPQRPGSVVLPNRNSRADLRRKRTSACRLQPMSWNARTVGPSNSRSPSTSPNVVRNHGSLRGRRRDSGDGNFSTGSLRLPREARRNPSSVNSLLARFENQN